MRPNVRAGRVTVEAGGKVGWFGEGLYCVQRGPSAIGAGGFDGRQPGGAHQISLGQAVMRARLTVSHQIIILREVTRNGSDRRPLIAAGIRPSTGPRQRCRHG
jgi:hypothetical protein